MVRTIACIRHYLLTHKSKAMKKIIVVITVSICFFSASAQEFRIGLKGAYNSTWLFNSNTSDQGELIDNASAFGSSFGLTMLYHFTDESAVSVDILMSTHNAKFEGAEPISSKHYEATDKLSYIDIPVLFHLGASDGGGYVEIGPQFSFLTGAKEDYTLSDVPSAAYSDRDVERDFNSMNIAAVLGFGYNFYLTDNLFLDAGLRFAYGLGDATVEFSETELTDADRSIASMSAHTDSDFDFNYVASHRAYGGLNLSLTYSFGQFSRHRN